VKDNSVGFAFDNTLSITDFMVRGKLSTVYLKKTSHSKDSAMTWAIVDYTKVFLILVIVLAFSCCICK